MVVFGFGMRGQVLNAVPDRVLQVLVQVPLLFLVAWICVGDLGVVGEEVEQHSVQPVLQVGPGRHLLERLLNLVLQAVALLLLLLPRVTPRVFLRPRIGLICRVLGLGEVASAVAFAFLANAVLVVPVDHGLDKALQLAQLRLQSRNALRLLRDYLPRQQYLVVTVDLGALERTEEVVLLGSASVGHHLLLFLNVDVVEVELFLGDLALLFLLVGLAQVQAGFAQHGQVLLAILHFSLGVGGALGDNCRLPLGRGHERVPLHHHWVVLLDPRRHVLELGHVNVFALNVVCRGLLGNRLLRTRVQVALLLVVQYLGPF